MADPEGDPSHVVVTGDALGIDDVVAVAREGRSARLAPSVEARMAPARTVVESLVASDTVAYGITTGFGALASTRVSPDQAAELQVNLLRSHAAGVGGPVPDDLVRAMLLLRARTLSQGHSGVRSADTGGSPRVAQSKYHPRCSLAGIGGCVRRSGAICPSRLASHRRRSGTRWR